MPWSFWTPSRCCHYRFLTDVLVCPLSDLPVAWRRHTSLRNSLCLYSDCPVPCPEGLFLALGPAHFIFHRKEETGVESLSGVHLWHIARQCLKKNAREKAEAP